MYISYRQWQDEVEKIKQQHGFTYLTRKKCREVAGWTWRTDNQYKYGRVKLIFSNPAYETFYTLKWGI